ncbi:Hypothetical protein CINCED_3A018880 [Cinara cedri]|uniref:Uncharacterized protein n=1 Tax=Cinara cedri TaxID=506608 RepID=A0A5E4MJC4_9HEMI|nr:Hypothetical protein CINCED_3A018880 [Cinara cedri]
MRSYSLTLRITKITVLFILALIVIQQASCTPMPGKHDKKNNREHDHDDSHNKHSDEKGSNVHMNGRDRWNTAKRKISNATKLSNHGHGSGFAKGHGDNSHNNRSGNRKMRVNDGKHSKNHSVDKGGYNPGHGHGFSHMHE